MKQNHSFVSPLHTYTVDKGAKPKLSLAANGNKLLQADPSPHNTSVSYLLFPSKYPGCFEECTDSRFAATRQAAQARNSC